MEPATNFVPVLTIGSGVKDIEFYKNAFGASESWRIKNSDGSVHVAAFSIDGASFRVHENGEDGLTLSPDKTGYTTVTIGLSVEDVQALITKAITAGATLLSPVTDFDYGYRQGEIKDPFGHRWLIEKQFDKEALGVFLQNV